MAKRNDNTDFGRKLNISLPRTWSQWRSLIDVDVRAAYLTERVGLA